MEALDEIHAFDLVVHWRTKQSNKLAVNSDQYCSIFR